MSTLMNHILKTNSLNTSNLNTSKSLHPSIQELQSHLLSLWTSCAVDQTYQNLFLVFIQSFQDPKDQGKEIEAEIKKTYEKNSLFFLLQENILLRSQIKSQIQDQIVKETENGSINKPHKLDMVLRQMCDKLKNLRRINLLISENILKMFEDFKITRQNSIGSLGRNYIDIFMKIDVQNQFIKESFLNEYVLFQKGYDPFFLVHYEETKKSQNLYNMKKHAPVSQLFEMNISYVYRLMRAQQKMLKYMLFIDAHTGTEKERKELINRQRLLRIANSKSNGQLERESNSFLPPIKNNSSSERNRLHENVSIASTIKQFMPVLQRKPKILRNVDELNESDLSEAVRKKIYSLRPIDTQDIQDSLNSKTPKHYSLKGGQRNNHSFTPMSISQNQSKVIQSRNPKNYDTEDELQNIAISQRLKQQNPDSRDESRNSAANSQKKWNIKKVLKDRRHYLIPVKTKEIQDDIIDEEDEHENEFINRNRYQYQNKYPVYISLKKSKLANSQVEEISKSRYRIKQVNSRHDRKQKDRQKEKDKERQKSRKRQKQSKKKKKAKERQESSDEDSRRKSRSKREKDQKTKKQKESSSEQQEQIIYKKKNKKDPKMISSLEKYSQSNSQSSSLGQNESRSSEDYSKSIDKSSSNYSKSQTSSEKDRKTKQKIINKSKNKKQLQNKKKDKKKADKQESESQQESPKKKNSSPKKQSQKQKKNSPKKQNERKSPVKVEKEKIKPNDIQVDKNTKQSKEAQPKPVQQQPQPAKSQPKEPSNKNVKPVQQIDESQSEQQKPVTSKNTKPSQNQNTKNQPQHSPLKPQKVQQIPKPQKVQLPPKPQKPQVQMTKLQKQQPPIKQQPSKKEAPPKQQSSKKEEPTKKVEPPKASKQPTPKVQSESDSQESQEPQASQNKPKSNPNKISTTSKIKMIPGKVTFAQFEAYIKLKKVHPSYSQKLEQNIKSVFNSAKNTQTYLNEFHLNDQLATIALCSPTASGNIVIYLWMPIEKVCDEKSSQFFFKKYLDYLEQQTTYKSIIYSGTQIPQLKNQGFVIQKEKNYARKRVKPITRQSFQLEYFFSMQAINISFVQTTDDSLFFSDQISPLSEQNSWCNPTLLNAKEQEIDEDLDDQWTIEQKIKSLSQANTILQKDQYDTFEVGEQKIIFKDINMSRSMLNRVPKLGFISNDGFMIVMGKSIVFTDAKRKVDKIEMMNDVCLYMGSGFKNVQEMTQFLMKIKDKAKQQDCKFAFKMFSKQVYGRYLVKDPLLQKGKAFYCNWDLNFAWRDEIPGKIIHDTTGVKNKYGVQSFFCVVEVKGILTLGVQIEKQDYLY